MGATGLPLLYTAILLALSVSYIQGNQNGMLRKESQTDAIVYYHKMWIDCNWIVGRHDRGGLQSSHFDENGPHEMQ